MVMSGLFVKKVRAQRGNPECAVAEKCVLLLRFLRILFPAGLAKVPALGGHAAVLAEACLHLDVHKFAVVVGARVGVGELVAVGRVGVLAAHAREVLEATAFVHPKGAKGRARLARGSGGVGHGCFFSTLTVGVGKCAFRCCAATTSGLTR